MGFSALSRPSERPDALCRVKNACATHWRGAFPVCKIADALSDTIDPRSSPPP